MKLSRAFLLSAAVTSALLFAACSSTETPADDDENEPLAEAGTTPKKDAGPAAPKKDSGTPPKDSGKIEPVVDAQSDAPVPPTGDGGPTLISPDPGTECTVVGEAFTRPCGSCGTQLAYCSPAHEVGNYGSCRSAEGNCAPGAVEEGAACGACGTTQRTCNAQCVFEPSGVCTGEVPGGCVQGTTEVRTTGCATGQTIVYQCNAACGFEVQAGAVCTGTAAFPVITIASTEATTVDQAVTAAEQVKGPRNLFYSCDSLSAQQVFGRVFEIYNPTAQAATVDVWNTVATQWDFVMIAYGSPPLAPADLVPACTAVNDLCSVAPYSATSNVCFAGPNGVQIPAGARRWVYVGNFSSADPARDYTLHVTTADLQ